MRKGGEDPIVVVHKRGQEGKAASHDSEEGVKEQSGEGVAGSNHFTAALAFLSALAVLLQLPHQSINININHLLDLQKSK